MFRNISLREHQATKLFKLSCNNSWSLVGLTVLKSFRPSVNIINLEFWKQSSTWFTNKLKSNGYKCDPCGTLSQGSDTVDPILTLCFQFYRNLEIQVIKPLLNPNIPSFIRRILWSTLFKSLREIRIDGIQQTLIRKCTQYFSLIHQQICENHVD